MMRIARHGEDGASHAVTYYAVVDTAAQKLAWLSLKPVTGRPISACSHGAYRPPDHRRRKYFRIENYEFPGGMQNKLHLLARRIAVPHPRGGMIDVTAPLPPICSNLESARFDAKRYDRSRRRRKTRERQCVGLLTSGHQDGMNMQARISK